LPIRPDSESDPGGCLPELGVGTGCRQHFQTTADNCAADVGPGFTIGTDGATIITGGGLGVLDAETSTSNTVGVVWQPLFADFSIAVDYFDIEVRDEVDQIGAARIVRQLL
jgi:iron complex outermembrane recepter protein